VVVVVGRCRHYLFGAAQRVLAAARFQVFAGSRHSVVVETTSKKHLKLAQKTILKTLSIFKIYHWGCQLYTVVRITVMAVRYEPSLVGTTAFDNVGYAFLGDVLNGQGPHTAIWADDSFNRTNDTQVPTAAYMDQLLAADPAL
jgi:hypothetical protein